MKVNRKIIEIDEELCDGCGQCILACAEGALEIVDGKAKVIADVLCDGLGACLGECPQGALKIIERQADEFDEAVVEEHLEKQRRQTAQSATPAKCPSGQLLQLKTAPNAKAREQISSSPSYLAHWPIQIRLIPPTAPFLKNADLLVVADCTAVALPTLHQDLVKGRVVMMGCPKFDDVQAYIERFAEVFRLNGVRSVTTVVMEVPCCAGLPHIVDKGIELSGQQVAQKTIVISRQGEVLEDPEGRLTPLEPVVR